MTYVFLDFECTCGEGIKHNEIIQIGAVKVNDKGLIIDSFNEYVKPKLESELTSYCKKLTNITQAQIDNAKSFEKVAEKFEAWHEDVQTIFVWGEDAKMWGNNCLIFDRENVTYPLFVDLQKIIKTKFKIRNINGLSAILNSLKLSNVYSHNALDDAYSLYEYVNHITYSFGMMDFEKLSDEFVFRILVENHNNTNYSFFITLNHEKLGDFSKKEFTIFDENQYEDEYKKEKVLTKNMKKLKSINASNISFENEESLYIYQMLLNKYLFQKVS